MPVEETVRDFLIQKAAEDYSKYNDEELEEKRKELEAGLQSVLKPYLSRKEFDEIKRVLTEMMGKIDSSIYDKRFAEKVKRTLVRVLNWCHAWERLRA